MQLDIKEVEELSKTLYIRALKLLPNDIKQGFERLLMEETDATGKTILGTMVENIAVAERTKNLLCQDTGIPIYNVVIGRHVEVRRRGDEASDPPRLRARHQGTSLALLRRASGDAQERADLVRRRRAGHQYRLRRARRNSRDRNDPERLRLGKWFVSADVDSGRWRRRDQAFRHRQGDRMRRPASVRRPLSASASAAHRTCACILPRSPRRGRSAPPAPTLKAPRSRRN